MSKNKHKKRSISNFASRILATYDLFDDDDISTERLLCLVADTCNCDIDDVVDVLVRYKAK